MVDLLEDDALLDLGARSKSDNPAGIIAEERERKKSKPFNSDLEEFAKGADKDASLCHSCQQHPPAKTCHSCGRRVCQQCSWTMLGLCQTCATEDRVSRFNQQHQPEGNNWLEK